MLGPSANRPPTPPQPFQVPLALSSPSWRKLYVEKLIMESYSHMVYGCYRLTWTTGHVLELSTGCHLNKLSSLEFVFWGHIQCQSMHIWFCFLNNLNMVSTKSNLGCDTLVSMIGLLQKVDSGVIVIWYIAVPAHLHICSCFLNQLWKQGVPKNGSPMAVPLK